MAAHLQTLIQAQGTSMISPQQGRLLFRYLLQQSVAQIGVLPIQWPRYLSHIPVVPPFYQALSTTTVANGSDLLAEISMLHQQLVEADQQERFTLLLHHLQLTVARILGFQDPAQIDPANDLLQMGLDSLMAIELRNQITRMLPTITVPVTTFIDGSLEQIAAYIAEKYLQTEFKELLSPKAGQTAIRSEQTEGDAEELIEEFVL